MSNPPHDTQTKLQQSLKELADIKFALDSSSIVAITDAAGVIIYVNDQFCRISRYSREELLGNTHRIINSGHHPPTFFRQMWETITSGQVWRGEVKNRARDGTFYWVDTTIVPFISDETGKPYQYVAIRNDISDRKRIESELRMLMETLEQRVYERTAELEEMVVRLQETERQREIFVSALTHDLRTPLVGQKRAFDLLSQHADKLSPRLAGLVDQMVGSNDALLNMVNKLLDAYKYEAGQVTLLKEPLSMLDVVQDSLNEVAILADSQQINLMNHVLSDLPLIRGDFEQLRRVLVNLLGNAIENCPPGSRIEVAARLQDGEIILTVSDDGPGIPEDVLPHLFERYTMMQRKQKKIGSGLGLSICRMIMQAHDGTISAESMTEPSEPEGRTGTTFTLTLPLTAGEENEA